MRATRASPRRRLFARMPARPPGNRPATPTRVPEPADPSARRAGWSFPLGQAGATARTSSCDAPAVEPRGLPLDPDLSGYLLGLLHGCCTGAAPGEGILMTILWSISIAAVFLLTVGSSYRLSPVEKRVKDRRCRMPSKLHRRRKVRRQRMGCRFDDELWINEGVCSNARAELRSFRLGDTTLAVCQKRTGARRGSFEGGPYLPYQLLEETLRGGARG
jgi:hypothetical protein